jgi:hypothetical protein
MGKKIEMAGKSFGLWNVLYEFGKDQNNGNIKWMCICKCGKRLVVDGASLRSGLSKNCGCIRKENTIKRNQSNTIHNLCHTKPYRLWASMKARCQNKNAENYRFYGARGIKVCEEWANDPAEFCKWAEENGYTEGLQIDRIDNDGNYEPENCRFVTPAENMKNR